MVVLAALYVFCDRSSLYIIGFSIPLVFSVEIDSAYHIDEFAYILEIFQFWDSDMTVVLYAIYLKQRHDDSIFPGRKNPSYSTVSDNS